MNFRGIGGILCVLAGTAGCGDAAQHGGPDGTGPDGSGTDGAGADGAGADAAVDAVAARCVPTPAGARARWRGEMTTADDVGTFGGTSPGMHVAYAAGQHGSAFSFNGTDAVVTVDDGDALWPAGSFSLEAWVLPAKTAAAMSVLQKYQCGGTCVGRADWQLAIESHGFAEFTMLADAAIGLEVGTITGSRDLTDGAWHHLVGVRDVTAKQQRLYVDGALAVSAALGADQLGPLTNQDGETDPVVIGAQVPFKATGFAAFFRGSVDEVAYFDAALTDAQVAAIYAAPEGECR